MNLLCCKSNIFNYVLLEEQEGRFWGRALSPSSVLLAATYLVLGNQSHLLSLPRGLILSVDIVCCLSVGQDFLTCSLPETFPARWKVFGCGIFA